VGENRAKTKRNLQSCSGAHACFLSAAVGSARANARCDRKLPAAHGGFPPEVDRQGTMATPPVTVKEVVSVRVIAWPVSSPCISPALLPGTKTGPDLATVWCPDPSSPTTPCSSPARASTQHASPSPTSRWKARSSSAFGKQARRTPWSSWTWRTRTRR